MDNTEKVINPVSTEARGEASPTEKSPLRGLLAGMTHKSILSPNDLFYRTSLHKFEPKDIYQNIQHTEPIELTEPIEPIEPIESIESIESTEKERSLWIEILASAAMIFVPFARSTVILVGLYQERKRTSLIQKLNGILSVVFSTYMYVPFFLLKEEPIWSDFLCLLLIDLIFNGISIFHVIIQGTHVRSFNNKRLYGILKSMEKRQDEFDKKRDRKDNDLIILRNKIINCLKRQRDKAEMEEPNSFEKDKQVPLEKEIATYQNLLLVVRGIIEAENMDIFSSVFKFQVLEGNQEKIEKIWNKLCESYSSALGIEKHKQQSSTQMMPYEGKELLFMALTNRQDVFKIFIFGTYIVTALRLAAMLTPLYYIEPFTRLITNHSDYFLNYAMNNLIGSYGMVPSVEFFGHLLRENVRDYYAKTKWIAYLINIDFEREYDFKQRPFKLNIFDENTLEVWFITLVLTKKTMTKRISYVERATCLYLAYIFLFGIFTGACYFLDVLDKEYFAYGYLFLLLPIDILTILPPVVIYLYYGLKVNEYSAELTSILNSLITLYEKLEDTVREPNEINFAKSMKARRYLYLWSCLKKTLNQTSGKDSFQNTALQKLCMLKRKVKSLQRRLHEEFDNNPYKFCGLLTCTMSTYQVIVISSVSAVWSSIVGFISQLLK